MLRLFASAIQSVLDVILPRKERVVRIDSYRIEDIPVAPEMHEVHDVRITTLTRYRSPVVEDLVRALKYDRAGDAAKLLAEVLAEYLREELASISAFSAKPIVLVPVPLHTSRLRERGFNQVERILRALPDEFRDGSRSRIAADALVRTRATPQQIRLSRAERLTNVEGAFALGAADGVRGAHIILIDDVTTTGATLRAAARPLEGETVTLLSLAHA